MRLVLVPFGLALSALVTPLAWAQSGNPASPYYAGLALGVFTLNDSTADTAAALTYTLGGTANVTQDTSSYAGRAFGGYHLDPSVSVEMGYYQTVSVTQQVAGVASNSMGYSGTTSLNISGVDYSVLLRPRRSIDHKGIFLRLGGHYLTVRGSATLSASKALASGNSYSGNGFFWGAGYDMPIKDSLNLRLEYTGYKSIAGKDGTSDNFCVAVVKHF